jgi:hypothetical protein
MRGGHPPQPWGARLLIYFFVQAKKGLLWLIGLQTIALCYYLADFSEDGLDDIIARLCVGAGKK